MEKNNTVQNKEQHSLNNSKEGVIVLLTGDLSLNDSHVVKLKDYILGKLQDLKLNNTVFVYCDTNYDHLSLNYNILGVISVKRDNYLLKNSYTKEEVKFIDQCSELKIPIYAFTDTNSSEVNDSFFFRIYNNSSLVDSKYRFAFATRDMLGEHYSIMEIKQLFDIVKFAYQAINTAKPRKVYISIPMNITWNVVDDIITDLIKECEDIPLIINYWVRGTKYGDREINLIKECDAFIMLTPDIEFSNIKSRISKGVWNEYVLARDNGKKCSIVYQPKMNNNTTYKFYNINEVSGCISGISGTTSSLRSYLIKDMDTSTNPCKEIPLNDDILDTSRLKVVEAPSTCSFTVPNKEVASVEIKGNNIMLNIDVDLPFGNNETYMFVSSPIHNFLSESDKRLLLFI